jgi:hypothetical protein
MSAFDNAFQSIRDKAFDMDKNNRIDSVLLGSGWARRTKNWSEYPLGTKARESWANGYWIKTGRGWKWFDGATFPIPGSSDQVMVPVEK